MRAFQPRYPYTVSAGPGDTAPLGSVHITSADGVVGCTAAASYGRCSVLTWTTGELTLTATYSGDATLLPSTDAKVVQVLGGAFATRTTFEEVGPRLPMAGEPVHVRASVRPCLPPFHCDVISGPITFTDVSDASTTCTAESPSQHCFLAFQTSGMHTVRAVYAGSGAFGPSGNLYWLTVGPRVFTFADGVMGPFFDTYLLLANPGATPEPVTITLFRDDGTAADLSTVIAPHGRITWKTDDLPALGGGAFSTKVTVPSGRPVFVERATYFADDYRAGHASMGRAPDDHAYFAEGCQNSLFDTYLLIGNQAAEPADVHVSFLIEGGELVDRRYVAAAGSRLSIAAAGIPELAGRSFGIEVDSSQPVAVERLMYFGQGYAGGHSEVGVPRASTTWLFAEGATGPSFDTFLLLMNPDPNQAASATIRYHTSAGRTVTRTRTVPVRGRATIEVEREDALLADTTFWIEVEADVPLFAERAMYWASDGGAHWTDGHVSAGATAARPRWGFAEGILGGGLDFKTFLLLANPGTSPATIDVQYLPTGRGPITQVHTVPAGGRLTINVEADVPALRDVPFGTLVTARTGGAVVAERSIYWTRYGPFFLGGTNTMGLGF